MIADFWLYKFKAVGFPTKMAEVFAYSVECQSQQFKQYDPDFLPEYLRGESEKRPHNFKFVPLVELLGRNPKDER